MQGQTAEALALDKMRRFYELFPYPNRSWLLEPDTRASCLAHAGFCRLLSERHPDTLRIWRELRQKPAGTAAWFQTLRRVWTTDFSNLLQNKFNATQRICLVGCGTDEPLLFRKMHLENEIVGIDLSQGSLRKARAKVRLAKLRHVLRHGKKAVFGPTHLLAGDATTLLRHKHMGTFQHIQCFGVLHHQPNPQAMLESMAAALAPGGTLRIMIYSHKGRRLERRVQGRYAALWEQWMNPNNAPPSSASPFAARSVSSMFPSWTALRSWARIKSEHCALRFWQFYNLLLNSEPTSDRFRYLGLSAASVADAFLHPSDPGLPPEKLLTWAKQAQLKLVFCEARLDDEGWVAGFWDAHDVWQRIVHADARGALLSNIIVVFKKEQA